MRDNTVEGRIWHATHFMTETALMKSASQHAGGEVKVIEFAASRQYKRYSI
jgi:hypothetical protein